MDYRPRWRTVDSLEGPRLSISRWPAGSTTEQIDRAFAAARKVFEDAGLDPVEVGWDDGEDPVQSARFEYIWDEAEAAATKACWEPRTGTPEPTKIEIYFE